jgi:RNA polymerase sigma-70 factor (ECF subfamily)
MLESVDREGDFYAFYERQAAAVLRYLRCALPGEADAEDLLADAFGNAWRAWDRFSGIQTEERTWIMRIARNLVIDHSRRGRLRLVGVSDSIPSMAAGPDAVAERLDIARALATLGGTERQLVALRLAGLTGQEIAKVQGRSHEAVRKSWQRALVRLRACLEEN